MLSSGHPTFSVLTSHEPSLPVDRTAVGEASRVHEDIGALAHFVIAQYAIIRDVAEEHEAARWVVCRPFEPAPAREESGYGTVASGTGKAGIQHLKLGRNKLDHSPLLAPDARARPGSGDSIQKRPAPVEGPSRLSSARSTCSCSDTWGGSSAG